MTTNKKEDTKKIIRSLLISARHGLTINELCSEYTAITSQALPYKELGYYSAIDMVKDMPDVVKPIFLSGGAMLLKGIADKSTEHIRQFVSNQKSVGYNTQILHNRQAKKVNDNIVPDSLRKKIASLISEYPKGIEMKIFYNKYINVYKRKLDYSHLGFTSLRALLERCSDILTVKVKDLQNQSIILYPVVRYHDITVPTTQKLPFIRSSVSEIMKMEVHLLLIKFNLGLKASKFLSEYEMCYKRQLNLNRLGFTSVIELMSKIPEVVRIERPTNSSDWILHSMISPNEFPAIATDQIQQSHEIQKHVGEVFLVYISYIISPSSFWFYVLDSVSMLEELMFEINVFYNSLKSKLYVPEEVVAGQLCCALYEDKRWYRAVVKNVMSKDKVKVYYVDYGNLGLVESTSIRYMLQEFSELPFQAFQAKLGNITAQNQLWTTEGIKIFFELTEDMELQAKLIKKGIITEVELFQQNSSLNIAQALSDKGFGLLLNDNQKKKSSNKHPSEAGKYNKDIQSFHEGYYETRKQIELVSLSNTDGPGNSNKQKTLPEEENPSMSFIKHVEITQELSIHIINHNKQAWISSSEISYLFWEADILRQMLRQKGLLMTKEILRSSVCAELFSTLKQYNIAGQVNCSGETILSVYLLQELPILFTVFNSKYENCHAIVTKEVNLWQEQMEKYWVNVQNKQNTKEIQMLKLQSLEFKKKRLYHGIITNSAETKGVTLKQIQHLEIQINALKQEINL